jgi:hypothetical protein
MTEEDRIHIAVVEYLRLRKQFFWHVPNQSKATIGWRAKMKRFGVRSGVPDIALVLPGGMAGFMEIKTAGGKLSTAQKDFRDDAIRAGAVWAEVRSVDDAAMALELWSAA